MIDTSKLMERLAKTLEDAAAKEANAIIEDAAKAVGLNPNSTWGLGDDFLQAAAPLRKYLKDRILAQKSAQITSKFQDSMIAIVKEEFNR